MAAVSERLSGVYQILCVPTGQIYIGSAVDLRARWERHRRGLRAGKHVNRYLQQAWDRYGEASFEFTVLEYVDAVDLLGAEQAWIDRTRCTDRKIGFNIYDTAGSPGSIRAREWGGFIDPDGNELTITYLLYRPRRAKGNHRQPFEVLPGARTTSRGYVSTEKWTAKELQGLDLEADR